MGDSLTEDIIYDSTDVTKQDTPFDKIEFFGISLQHFSDISIITSMHSLKIIQLRLCNLVEFPPELFSLPSLESIDLSGNSITNLTIHLKNENETEIQDVWQLLPNLTTLNLGENTLNDLNEIFKIKTLPSLKHLTLTGNICLTAFNAFNRICEAFPKLLALNDCIITSQHRAIVKNIINYISESTIPLVDAENYLFLYVKYLKCSVNERPSRRLKAQFFCVNRILRRCSAATKIQSVFRGFQKRNEWELMKKCGLFLQTRIKFWCHLRAVSARRIQGLFRCYKARQVVKEYRNARKIQGFWRCYLNRDNSIISLFENANEKKYQFYISDESLRKFYKFLDGKSIDYKKSLENKTMLVEENDDFKIIKIGPLKKRNLPGSPSVYYNVDDSILIRRKHHHGMTPNSIWCGHDHSKLESAKQVSQYGVNFTPACHFKQIKYIPYTKEIHYKKFSNYETLKLATFTDVPLFRKIIKSVVHSFPEGVILFPSLTLNEAASQLTLHSAARMFITRNKHFHKMKEIVIEKRASKSIKAFIRTKRITRFLSHISKMLHYSETIPEAMTFFVPLKFLNIVKLDIKDQKDLIEYESENFNKYSFKNEKPVNTHLMHSDYNPNDTHKKPILKEKDNGSRNRMKNLQITLRKNDNDDENQNQQEDEFDNINLDPSLKKGFPIKYPSEFGFTEEKCVTLSSSLSNPFLSSFIPCETIYYPGKSLSMLPTFETTIRPALPSMFSVPITKKTINIGRIMRITFSSPEEAFRRLFIFAYLTGDTTRFMIDTEVVEYCAALLIQNHWRGYLYRRDYRHFGAQKGRSVNPAILLKQFDEDSLHSRKPKLDEPPPTFKKLVRKELPPEVAIANLRGDYRSWESLHRRRKINDLAEFNDKPYKSTIFPDYDKIQKQEEQSFEDIKTDSMKNVGLVNDLDNAYKNLSTPIVENELSMKRKNKLEQRNLIELSKSSNGHINEETRSSVLKANKTVTPSFEIEIESQKIFSPSFNGIKEIDAGIGAMNTLKELSKINKEAIKPIDTSEKAYESIKQFYTFEKRYNIKKDNTYKSPPPAKSIKLSDKGADESNEKNEKSEKKVDFDDFIDNYYTPNESKDDFFPQSKTPPLTSTPRTPQTAGRSKVQFPGIKSNKNPTTDNETSTQKVVTPSNKKNQSKVKIDVLAGTSKAIKKARPESTIDRVRPLKPLTDANEKSSKTPKSPQIRVPTPKLQTAHYKPPQMKDSEFTESLVAPQSQSSSTATTPIGNRLKSTDKQLSSNSSKTATIVESSIYDIEIDRPFTSLMITSPQWTDNSMRDALRRAFNKLVRLHQLGIEIGEAMVVDNTIAEKRMNTQQARDKVNRAREELKINKEDELIDLMERNKIEQNEREEKVRQVRARTALTRTRSANKVRKIHKDAISKYKKERDFALNFVSVSRKIAQQIETKQLNAEKKREMEEAQSKVQRQHEEAKETIEKYKQKVKEMDDYKRKIAMRDKLINEEKRSLQTEYAQKRFEMLSIIKEDEKMMKEAYRTLKNEKKVVQSNVPQPIETDEVEGAALIIKNHLGTNLGEVESHLLCQIISEIV